MLELYFFNVGHGDSIAVKFPNEEWGVIDCNRNREDNEPNVLKFLKSKNVTNLKFLAVTHFHEDHFKGIDTITDYFGDNISNFLIPTLRNNSKLGPNNLNSLNKALKKVLWPNKSHKLKVIEDGNTYCVADIEIKLLNPNIDIVKECFTKYVANCEALIFNKESLVLLFKYAGKKILLTGDVTSDVWENILKENGDISADILKISHHGSIENNPSDLLNVILGNNCYTVISSDGNNKYKSLPSHEVINYITNNKNSEVLNTYNLNQNIAQSNNYQNIDNLKTNKIIDGIAKRKQTTKYDGYFKIVINDDGNISYETIPTI